MPGFGSAKNRIATRISLPAAAIAVWLFQTRDVEAGSGRFLLEAQPTKNYSYRFHLVWP